MANHRAFGDLARRYRWGHAESKWGLSAPVPTISPAFVGPVIFEERKILAPLDDWKPSCLSERWEEMRAKMLEIADYYLEDILMGSAKAYACLGVPDR